MSKCTKCGCNLIGTAASPPKDQLCHYCERDRLRNACKLVLLFHSSGHWDEDKRIEWANLLTEILGPADARDPKVVGANGDGTWDGAAPTNEATTKNLCNAVRKALGLEEKRPHWMLPLDEHVAD